MPRCSVEGCERKYYAKGWCQMHLVRVRKYGTPDGGQTNHAPPEVRFWRRVRKGDPKDCWEWTGARFKSGYGSFQVGGKGSPSTGAHRIAYDLHYGNLPMGRALVVMHSCDNRGCVNPHHLSLGTPKQNTADMHARGRSSGIVPFGIEHFRAKLNPELVRMIRVSSDTNKAIAERLGLGINTVRGARIGRTWKHVT